MEVTVRELLAPSLYGDLEPLMNDTRSVQLTHVAEAMKIFPPNGFPPTEPPSYGFVTQGAIALVEIQRPNVNRSFCIAISAVDFPAADPRRGVAHSIKLPRVQCRAI